jgi:hypothetical protein
MKQGFFFFFPVPLAAVPPISERKLFAGLMLLIHTTSDFFNLYVSISLAMGIAAFLLFCTPEKKTEVNIL